VDRPLGEFGSFHTKNARMDHFPYRMIRAAGARKRPAAARTTSAGRAADPCERLIIRAIPVQDPCNGRLKHSPTQPSPAGVNSPIISNILPRLTARLSTACRS
jgi:hypothetical protein